VSKKDLTTLYKTDEYIGWHPSLHAEDSPWKVSQVIPMVDKFIKDYCPKEEINILDVGGGAGLVLKAVSSYIQEQHGLKVNKYALDLSPGMLKVQREANPDIEGVFNEDITETSIKDKEMDLVLMIDVLEHIPEPSRALEELRRIARFVIFKIPLEDNIYDNTLNLFSRGKYKKEILEKSGHISSYNFRKLRSQIEAYAGDITDYYFTNVFRYYLNSEYYRNQMSRLGKLHYRIASYTYKLSPRLCSYIFSDFVMLLVKTDNT